jgi:UDP-GlcNAc:undecaprenyl-phosphate GlcNAc-1-phosphate transferase
MEYSVLQFFLLGALTFVFVGAITPLMRKLALNIGAVDAPNLARKVQKSPVPYLGGVAIALGVVGASYGSLLAVDFTMETFRLASFVLVPAMAISAMGLVDDLRGLQPWPRLIAQTFTGVIVAVILTATDTMGVAFGNTYLNYAISVLWIVGVCNSINFFDNLDGGAAGTVAVTSSALFVLGFQGQQFLIAALSAVTAGATIGFLLWNKSPARIYMGDAGALFLGVLIATLTIRLHPDTDVMWTSLATPVLLLAVPILDTSVAVISRIKRGISPFQGGHDHLSHRLIRGGLSRRTAAFSLWGLSGFFALCAIAIPRTSEGLEQIIVAVAALVWAVLFIKFFQSKDA